jgi:hypothetical protein
MIFAPNDPRSLGQPSMHPRRLAGEQGLFAIVQRLDRKRDVIQRRLQKGPRIAAFPFGEAEIHQFSTARPGTLPCHGRETALLHR